MEAIAKHNFEPTTEESSDELSFRQDSKLIILDYGSQSTFSGWFLALDENGQKGFVPCNYIDILTPDWFHGRLSRIEAERKLQASPTEGAFLVRMSESSPGQFSLSVNCGNSVQHFRILKNNENDRFLLWEHKDFRSIRELIDHYRVETVSRSNQIRLRDMKQDNSFLAQAIYDFEPAPEQGNENGDEEASTELGFKKGEWITVIDDSDKFWWNGIIGDRQGFFPASYVRRDEPNGRDALEN